MAQNLLFHLTEYLQEMLPLLNDIEKQSYFLAINQITAMKRTIIHNDEFFEIFFLDKTYEEVIDWIEDESKKW